MCVCVCVCGTMRCMSNSPQPVKPEQVRRRKSDNKTFNVKGLLVTMFGGALASASISMQSGTFGKTEALRAGVAAGIAAVAFMQPRRTPADD